MAPKRKTGGQQDPVVEPGELRNQRHLKTDVHVLASRPEGAPRRDLGVVLAVREQARSGRGVAAIDPAHAGRARVAIQSAGGDQGGRVGPQRGELLRQESSQGRRIQRATERAHNPRQIQAYDLAVLIEGVDRGIDFRPVARIAKKIGLTGEGGDRESV
jgi:hypothetical protein